MKFNSRFSLRIRFSLTDGVREGLEFSIPLDEADAFENAHLHVTWDEMEESIYRRPIALFYGTGTLYNRDNCEYLVKRSPSTWAL